MSTPETFGCYCCGEEFPQFHPGLPDGTNSIGLYEGTDVGGCRAIVICSACMEKGDFDMWTDEAEWDSKDPVVSYRLLPPYDHEDPEKDDPAKYPSPQELLQPSGKREDREA